MYIANIDDIEVREIRMVVALESICLDGQYLVVDRDHPFPQSTVGTYVPNSLPPTEWQ